MSHILPHFLMGFLISMSPVPADTAYTAAIGASVGKEIYDSHHGGSFDAAEAASAILGASIAHNMRTSHKPQKKLTLVVDPALTKEGVSYNNKMNK